MKESRFILDSTLDPDQLDKNYRVLFATGTVSDGDLERRIAKLSRMFKVYADRCPVSCWAPGLAVSDELCRVTETFLDFVTIRRALQRLVSRSLRIYSPPVQLFSMSDSWIRVLNSLPQFNSSPDPASLIRHLSENEADRVRFLFSLHLPEQFGGSFGRYPGQSSFLRNWVSERYLSCENPIHCLDAACGSGEGSYELAGTLLESGVDASRIKVTGVTISPLEIFAAAHAFFPHDLKRQERYRRRMADISGKGSMPDIHFMAGDLNAWETAERYRVIICNGILGGQFLHERSEVERVAGRLAGCLLPGGIFLAADRFHGGWKKILPRSEMEGLLRGCGLEVLPVAEGIAGVRR